MLIFIEFSEIKLVLSPTTLRSLRDVSPIHSYHGVEYKTSRDRIQLALVSNDTAKHEFMLSFSIH
jgi:hypothetical protein